MSRQQRSSSLDSFIQVHDIDEIYHAKSSSLLTQSRNGIRRIPDDDFNMGTLNTMNNNCSSLSLADHLRRRMSLDDSSGSENSRHQHQHPNVNMSQRDSYIMNQGNQSSTKRSSINFPDTSINEKRKKRRKRMHRSKKLKAATKTAAVYYGECYLKGIGQDIADEAAQNSHRDYRKWWLQEISSDGVSSIGDAFRVPKFRQTLHPKSIHKGKTERPTEDAQKSNETSKVSPTLLPKTHSDTDHVNTTHNDSVYLTVTHDDYSCQYTFEKSKRNLEHSIKKPTARRPLLRRNLEQDLDSLLREDIQNQKSTSPIRSTLETPKLKDDQEQNLDDNRTVNTSILRPQPLRPRVPAYQKIARPLTTNSRLYLPDLVTTNTGSENNERSRITYISRLPTVNNSGNNDETDLSQPHQVRAEPLQNHYPYDNGTTILLDDTNFHDTRSAEEEHISQNKNNNLIGGEYMTSATDTIYNIPREVHSPQNDTIPTLKTKIIHELACTAGDVTDKKFLSTLEKLRALYQITGWNACKTSSQNHIEGLWLTLSRPNFPGSLGRNAEGDYLYTLGRMSFDMFRPINLICSLNAMFNSIKPQSPDTIMSVPKSLQEEVKNSTSKLRSYDIITAFTIEPESLHFGENSPNNLVSKPVKGIMTVYAHILPDPKTPNRFSVWFTSGEIEPNNSPSDQKEWQKIFGGILPKRSLSEMAKMLAVKLLMGAHPPEKMEEDGKMRYSFDRPIGGHGTAYVDTLYVDESLCIVQGHAGSIFVHMRAPSQIK